MPAQAGDPKPQVPSPQALLETLCAGLPVDKRRHLVPFGDHHWEIDEFEGANAGLVVAEGELADPGEPFESPPWLGREVTDEERYYNVYLARHPYSEWT